jgi:hypothetical protein
MPAGRRCPYRAVFIPAGGCSAGKKLNTSTILLILALLIFAGCASNPITPIKKDSPAAAKDESCFLLVRIRVKNHSGAFLEKFFDNHPRIGINKIEYDKKDSHILFTHFDLYSGTEKDTQETWKAEKQPHLDTITQPQPPTHNIFI